MKGPILYYYVYYYKAIKKQLKENTGDFVYKKVWGEIHQ